MHGVTDPGDCVPCMLDCLDQGWQLAAELLGAHAHNDGQPAWGVLRVEGLQQEQCAVTRPADLAAPIGEDMGHAALPGKQAV